ncbi:hypothetical protein SUGI_1375410 [Cryptomeria japonica]|uniref:Uncharacterized protein n=1 Tax=Cryptomeria japonica TaxID=3369 RepID=A0AAD3RQV8_CRYJA|nr:hypothetical protein SUGI_1375410 [Cryptomeria japonica]
MLVLDWLERSDAKILHQDLSIVMDTASLLIAMQELIVNLYAALVWTRPAEWFGNGSRSNTSLQWPQSRDRVPAMNVLDSSWAFWDGSRKFGLLSDLMTILRMCLLNAIRALSENLYPASTQTSLAEWFGTGSRSNTSLLWPPRRFDSSPRLAFGLLGGFCPIRK